jgi:hypothetical protein
VLLSRQHHDLKGYLISEDHLLPVLMLVFASPLEPVLNTLKEIGWAWACTRVT